MRCRRCLSLEAVGKADAERLEIYLRNGGKSRAHRCLLRFCQPFFLLALRSCLWLRRRRRTRRLFFRLGLLRPLWRFRPLRILPTTRNQSGCLSCPSPSLSLPFLMQKGGYQRTMAPHHSTYNSPGTRTSPPTPWADSPWAPGPTTRSDTHSPAHESSPP